MTRHSRSGHSHPPAPGKPQAFGDTGQARALRYRGKSRIRPLPGQATRIAPAALYFHPENG